MDNCPKLCEVTWGYVRAFSLSIPLRMIHPHRVWGFAFVSWKRYEKGDGKRNPTHNQIKTIYDIWSHIYENSREGWTKNTYNGEATHVNTAQKPPFLSCFVPYFNQAMAAQDNSGDMDLEGFDVETFMEMVNAAGLRFHKTCDEREELGNTKHGVGRGRMACHMNHLMNTWIIMIMTYTYVSISNLYILTIIRTYCI